MSTAFPEPTMETGRVISRGFQVLGANILPFSAIALLLSGGTSFAAELLFLEQGLTDDDSLFVSGYFWGALCLQIVTAAVVQAILVRSAVLSLGGRAADIGGSIVLTISLFPQIVGLTLATSLLILGGVILLIVPGVILYIKYLVVVPAMIVDRRGVGGSMRRSADLTSGVRGPIFAVLIVLFLFTGGLEFALSSLLTGLIEADSANAAVAFAGLGAFLDTITALLFAALTASVYVELRATKEGDTTDQLADVFS